MALVGVGIVVEVANGHDGWLGLTSTSQSSVTIETSRDACVGLEASYAFGKAPISTTGTAADGLELFGLVVRRTTWFAT